jgi:hypothetical protein
LDLINESFRYFRKHVELASFFIDSVKRRAQFYLPVTDKLTLPYRRLAEASPYFPLFHISVLCFYDYDSWITPNGRDGRNTPIQHNEY